jgi:anaerobic selenocysteine-containing dehydrogenase
MSVERTTYCRICEVYCGMIATVDDGRVTALRPDEAHVVSKGYSCPKGLAAHHLAHDPDRVLHPLRRVDGGWRRASWEEAIEDVATRLDRIRAEHGPHAIALYTGNPAGYSYSHRIWASNWIAAIGSRNSFGAGSQDNLADFLASKLLYGAAFLQPVPDVARTRHLLVVAVNPAVSQGTLVHMVNAKARLRAIRERGGKVVVIDPRRTETAKLASEHHFIRPDSDVWLLLAMTHVILAEGLEARAFLDRHATGLDRLRAAVERFTPERAAERTGIPADTVRRLAREFAGARRACAWGRVVCGRFGTLAAWSLEVLNVVTGNLDAPGGAILPDGAIDLVDVVEKLDLDHYGRHRSRVGDRPGVLGELPSGVLADEITTPGPGQVRALVVTAGNPVLSTANGPRLAEAMRRLECVVALDFYRSETAALAHWILPCTTYFEREDFPYFHAGLMTEPYAQWTEAVIPPQGEAKQEWEVFALLSDAMRLPYLNSRAATWARRALRLVGRDLSPRWIMDAMIRLGPYGDRYLPWGRGLTLERVAAHPHGMRLPDVRTGVLARRLRTPDRKVHLWNELLGSEIERLERSTAVPDDPAYPLRLIGRRDLRSNNSWLHNLPRLMRGDRCHRLRVHPADAARLGLADGAPAVVRSTVGALTVEVRVTDEVMPGVVSLPHGWGHTYGTERRVAERDPGPNCNALIDERVIEPLAGMAFLNGFPVAVEPVAASGVSPAA